MWLASHLSGKNSRREFPITAFLTSASAQSPSDPPVVHVRVFFVLDEICDITSLWSLNCRVIFCFLHKIIIIFLHATFFRDPSILAERPISIADLTEDEQKQILKMRRWEIRAANFFQKESTLCENKKPLYTLIYSNLTSTTKSKEEQNKYFAEKHRSSDLS